MFAQAFEEQARSRTNQPFIQTSRTGLSWLEAFELTQRAAAMLEELGVGPGARVALAAKNSPLYVLAWFAVRWLGASLVPLHDQLTPSALQAVLFDSSATLTISDGTCLKDLQSAGVPTFHIDGFGAFAELVSSYPSLPAHNEEASDEAALIYTSGTTGKPKGVVISSNAQLKAAHKLAAAIELKPRDRMAVCLPLFHTNPQIYAVMTTLFSGGSIALFDSFVPATFFNDAAALGGTCFSYVGTILHRLCAYGEISANHDLRFCVGGGAPLEVWKEFEDRFQIRVLELYGMTETAGWVTCSTPEESRLGSCGRARDDVDVSVVDARDNVLPPGEVGEIVVRPTQPYVLFDQYHNNAEVTVARTRNLWFHTGDLGSIDEDGYLYFRGRSDDQIRRAGENIDPIAVATALAKLDSVREVVVVGIPDPALGQEVKAIMIADPPPAPEAIIDACAHSLPRFAWPRFIQFVQEIPKTPTEKVESHRLRHRDPNDIDMRQSIRDYIERGKSSV
jgi:acyl-CoA synthetase (AMP-forming)/AMP-acid ligase II